MPPQPRWLMIARDELGQISIADSKHNPRIIEYHASAVSKATNDETPWGSSFVNWCLGQAGITGTKSARASSWLSWGSSCQAKPGAITIIYNESLTKSRAKLSGDQVGFLVGETNTHYILMGGDQGGKLGKVKEGSFPKSKWKLKGYRWPSSSPVQAVSSGGNPEAFSKTTSRPPQAQSSAVKQRSLADTESELLMLLNRLGVAAAAEGTGGATFQVVIGEFRKTLQSRLESLRQGDTLPADVNLVLKAVSLWIKDTGNQWGEGVWDSDDLTLSAPGYAKVPASQYKCNAYVSEAIYQSMGKVFLIHPSDGEKGKFFPYQARDWGNANLTIPNFKVVTMAPAMGDIWSNGSHTGIYLGTYSGKKLYISARDDGSGVFGLEQKMQYAHGIQFKYLQEGGVYRRYTP